MHALFQTYMGKEKRKRKRKRKEGMMRVREKTNNKKTICKHQQLSCLNTKISNEEITPYTHAHTGIQTIHIHTIHGSMSF